MDAAALNHAALSWRRVPSGELADDDEDDARLVPSAVVLRWVVNLQKTNQIMTSVYKLHYKPKNARI